MFSKLLTLAEAGIPELVAPLAERFQALSSSYVLLKASLIMLVHIIFKPNGRSS